jgi:hypothetical protein
MQTKKLFNEKLMLFNLADDRLLEAAEAVEDLTSSIEKLLHSKRQTMYETLNRISEESASLGSSEEDLKIIKSKLRKKIGKISELEN